MPPQHHKAKHVMQQLDRDIGIRSGEQQRSTRSHRSVPRRWTGHIHTAMLLLHRSNIHIRNRRKLAFGFHRADPNDPHGDWEQIWTISRQCKGKPHFLQAMEEFYSQ
jgi:hypothetical protein